MMLPGIIGGVSLPGGITPVPPSVWTGMNENLWRGETIPRTRAKDAAVTGTLVSIAPGTSVASILSQIAAVPTDQDMTLHFQAGVHAFNDCLLIQRGNITVQGEGEDETILKSIMVSPNIRCPLIIQSPAIRNQTSSSNHGRWRGDSPNVLIGSVTQAFNFFDKALTLDSVVGLAVNNFIMAFKSTTGSGNLEFSTMAQVTAINGNTISLSHPMAFSSSNLQEGDELGDIKVYKVPVLENVTVRNFSVEYDTDLMLASVQNPFDHDIEDLLNARENNWFPDYAAKDSRNYGNLIYGNHRAVCVSGTHEHNIINVRCANVGSTAFWFSACLEPYGENLQVDECWNKGVGGNGYGVEYDKCYWGEFINLDLRNCRHSVSANMLGGNGFNNFHVLYTTTNLDFHGGRDQGNIYLVDEAVMEACWLMLLDPEDDTFTYELDLAAGKYPFKAMDYRHENNEAENTVFFKEITACTGTLTGGIYLDALGDKLNAALGTSHDDILYAWPGGSTIIGGFGNDTLVGGPGDDILDCGLGASSAGVNSDIIRIYSGGGNDTVRNFQISNDKIHIERDANGAGFDAGADVLAAATQAGSHVVVNLGAGNSVTIENVLLANLTASHFVIFDA